MSDWRPGPRNLVTDLPGVRVGNAQDDVLRSGVTILFFDKPAIASVAVLGGAPGTRETDLLAPENTVQAVDGFVLSGGSAFGLDTASGAQAFLREQGRGFAVGDARVPIVPAAILFDLENGGDKGWGRFPPYRDLGYEAAARIAGTFELGSVGAGCGASTAVVKGSLGSASCILASGVTVAAIVAVNALGSPLIGTTRHFWAAPFELGEEFGGLGCPNPFPTDAAILRTKLHPKPGVNTTIGVVGTDAVLSKAAAKRLAIAGHDGLGRAIWPAHTDFDGDLLFACATGTSGRTPDDAERIEIAAAASAVVARSVARGIHAARSHLGDRRPA